MGEKKSGPGFVHEHRAERDGGRQAHLGLAGVQPAGGHRGRVLLGRGSGDVRGRARQRGGRGGFCKDRVAASLEAAGLPEGTVSKSSAAGATPYSEEVVRAFFGDTFQIGEDGDLVYTKKGSGGPGVVVENLRAKGADEVVFEEAGEGSKTTVRMRVRADAEKVVALFAEAQIERWKRTAMGFVYTRLSPLWICTLDNLILAPVDALKDMVEKNLGWIPGGAVVLMVSLAVQKLGDFIYRQGAATGDLQYKIAGIVIGLFCDLKNGGNSGAHRSILQVAPMVCLQPLLRFAQVYDMLMLTIDSFRHETPPATTIQVPRSLALEDGDTEAVRALIGALNNPGVKTKIFFGQEANRVEEGEIYLRIMGEDGEYTAKSNPTLPRKKPLCGRSSLSTAPRGASSCLSKEARPWTSAARMPF